MSIKLGEKPLLEVADKDEAYAATAALHAAGGSDRWLDVMSSRERLALAGDSWHEVLNVFPNATSEEVRKAYRELSLLHHPDKSHVDGDDETFKRIVQAYEDALAEMGGEAERKRRAALKARLKTWIDGDRPTEFVEFLDFDEVADLLMQDECVIIDMTDRGMALTSEAATPFVFENLSYMDLRYRPNIYEEQLKVLRSNGKTLVAISQTGGRCGEFCAMLIDVFGFDADSVRRISQGYLGLNMWWADQDQLVKKKRDKLRAHLGFN